MFPFPRSVVLNEMSTVIFRSKALAAHFLIWPSLQPQEVGGSDLPPLFR